MMEDPIDDAITRWFGFMGTLDPTEAEKQVFMFYNSVIPDVKDEATYLAFLASVLDQDDTARLSNMPACIWFHITLFKGATYEIEACRDRALHRLFPEAMDDFAVDYSFGNTDPVAFAKTLGQPETQRMH